MVKVLMLVGDFVESLEVYGVMFALQCCGIQVDTCCPDKNTGDKVQGAVHDFTDFQTYEEKKGHLIPITLNFESVNPGDYDGLWIPGGRAPEYLRTKPKVVEIVNYFLTQNKPIGAMCHGA